MVVKAIVKVGYDRDFTVETIACFDDCIYCGKKRIKDQSGKVNTSIGTLYVHYVRCCCPINFTPHKILDEEWMVIRMLNEFGIDVSIDLTAI
jgi:hypothetical protein